MDLLAQLVVSQTETVNRSLQTEERLTQLQEFEIAKEHEQHELMAKFKMERRELEQERRQWEDERFERQMEWEDRRQEITKRSRLADRMTPWTDMEHPTAYLRFEHVNAGRLN